ncbi:MAG TPA: hypothetical protein DCZ94_13290 [Lentisphaeria bacterium]|nr:MAG: hypothetical protein A2X48_24420 [Lentisphaerae bacterium GWF2_49_21]HBC87922.1 hypothetical protein [Lentisphaeria bacterium]
MRKEKLIGIVASLIVGMAVCLAVYSADEDKAVKKDKKEIEAITINILDYETQKPVKGAKISLGEAEYTTDENGHAGGIKVTDDMKSWIDMRVEHPEYYSGFDGVIHFNPELNVMLLPNSMLVKAEGKVEIPAGVKTGCKIGVFVEKPGIEASEPEWRKWKLAMDDGEVLRRFGKKSVDGKNFEVFGVMDSRLMAGSSVRVDKDGKFSVDFIAPKGVDKFKIIASCPDIGFAETTAGKDRLKDINLELAPEGGVTVGGKIQDDKGAPIKGAKLSCELTAAKAETDEQGMFKIANCWPELFYFDINAGKNLKTDSIYPNNSFTGAFRHKGTWDKLQIVCVPPGTKLAPPAEDSNDPFSPAKFEKKAMEALGACKFEDAARNFALSTLLNTREVRCNNLANSALAKVGLGDFRSAYEDCQEGRRINPLSPYVTFVQGWVALMAGKKEIAEKCFLNSVSVRKFDPYDALGLYLASLSLGKENKKVLEDAFSNSEDEKIKPLLKSLLESGGIGKIAENSDADQKTDIYFYGAEIAKIKGDKEKAREYFSKVLELKKTNTIEFMLAKAENEILDGRIKAEMEISSARGEDKILFDFGKDGISEIFNEPQGGLTFSVEDIPLELPETVEGRPSGKVLRIKSPAKGFMYTKKDKLPEDIPECESASMWVYRPSGGEPVVFEVQFIEDKGRAKFWRKVEVVKAGWSKVVVPLRYMRQSDERSPSWKNVKHLGFFFRGDAEICIDNISLLSKTGKTAVVTPEELAEISFPGTPKDQIKIVKNQDFIIVSNSKELEIDKLEKRMIEFFGLARKGLAGVKMSTPDSPPILAVFATQDEYRNFTPRLAGLLLGQAAPPTSGGYTLHSIATSFWDPERGTFRPVYFHEMLHSWLDKMYGFPCGNGDWIQEGIANYYQLSVFPQDDLDQIILNGIAAQNIHMPLKELCSGKRVPMDRYWQALSVIAMLLDKEGYKENFAKLLDVLIEKKSTDLNPVIKDVLGVDMEKFTSDWKDFCRDYAKQLKR